MSDKQSLKRFYIEWGVGIATISIPLIFLEVHDLQSAPLRSQVLLAAVIVAFSTKITLIVAIYRDRMRMWKEGKRCSNANTAVRL